MAVSTNRDNVFMVSTIHDPDSLPQCYLSCSRFGLATLWMAIAADTGASLPVIFNGLQLLRSHSGVYA